MTVKFSRSLSRRLNAEIRRAIGSNASLVFYNGVPPDSPDEHPTGQKIRSNGLNEEEIERINAFKPVMPEDASYWRIIDAAGIVVAQGE